MTIRHSKMVEVICKSCDTHRRITEYQFRHLGDKPFYCNRECKNAYIEEQRIIKAICNVCGEEFETDSSQPRKTCSDKCRAIASSIKYKGRVPDVDTKRRFFNARFGTKDLILQRWRGKRFYSWHVIGSKGHYEGQSRFFLDCKCDCGTEKMVCINDLISDRTRSCGCRLWKKGANIADLKH